MDYSKWDKFAEISDSDEEVHPNIDAKSFHKFKRQQDLERREENRKVIEALQAKETLTQEENSILDKALKMEEKFRARFDELHEKYSYTHVANEKKGQKHEEKKSEEEKNSEEENQGQESKEEKEKSDDDTNSDEYVRQMEIKAMVLVKLVSAQSWTQARDHLRSHPDLICDESETYFLLHMRDLIQRGEEAASKPFCTSALLIKYLLPLDSRSRQHFFQQLINHPPATREFVAAAAEYWQTVKEKLLELWSKGPEEVSVELE